MSETQYCPTCGCPVRIGGEGVTKYYVPILKEKADKLCEAAKAIENDCEIGGGDKRFGLMMTMLKAIAEYEGAK